MDGPEVWSHRIQQCRNQISPAVRPVHGLVQKHACRKAGAAVVYVGWVVKHNRGCLSIRFRRWTKVRRAGKKGRTEFPLRLVPTTSTQPRERARWPASHHNPGSAAKYRLFLIQYRHPVLERITLSTYSLCVPAHTERIGRPTSDHSIQPTVVLLQITAAGRKLPSHAAVHPTSTPSTPVPPFIRQNPLNRKQTSE
jgi:hypothetical protein